MNTCIITGLKTNNKWKGQFIHRSVVDSAVRAYGCSTRDALIHSQETIRKNRVGGFRPGPGRNSPRCDEPAGPVEGDSAHPQ